MGITCSNTFFNKKQTLSKAALKKAAKAIQRVEDAPFEEERIKALRELLSIYEKGALAIRQELEAYNIKMGIDINSQRPECVQDLPVEIIEEEDALIIKTPITIKRKNNDYSKGNSEGYFLSQYVYAAITSWKYENGISDQYLYQKFDADKFDMVFIIKRKATFFNDMVHCDNDNIENNTIQNVICAALALGDCCLYMDHLYSCFRLTDSEDDTGTEFIITARKNLAKYTKKTVQK